MHDVFILSAVRTPIGKFGGSLASLSAADMGVVAAKAALERAGVQPTQVEETIFGNARQAGGGPNPARQISIRSGIPQEVPAYTVNQACASGIKSIALAFQEIAVGNIDCALAGGTESMSRLPYYLEGARWGYRLGNQELVDGMVRDGFFCPLAKMLMGETAEILAAQYHISRDEQDQFALLSQQRAAAAQSTGRFDAHDAGINADGSRGDDSGQRLQMILLDELLTCENDRCGAIGDAGRISRGYGAGLRKNRRQLSQLIERRIEKRMFIAGEDGCALLAFDGDCRDFGIEASGGLSGRGALLRQQCELILLVA